MSGIEEQQEGFVALDPVQHLRELHDIVGDDEDVTDEEITDWIAEGGPAYAYEQIAARLA